MNRKDMIGPGQIVRGKGLKKTCSRDKKPKGFEDLRAYEDRLKDALNTFEIREITDRIRLQNFWCSFIKQPKNSDVPVIEAYVVLKTHEPDVFNCKVWTYKDDVIKHCAVETARFMSQTEKDQRSRSLPDFITQARYDINAVVKYAQETLPSL